MKMGRRHSGTSCLQPIDRRPVANRWGRTGTGGARQGELTSGRAARYAGQVQVWKRARSADFLNLPTDVRGI